MLNIAVVRTKWFAQAKLLLWDAAIGGKAEEIVLETSAMTGSRYWGTGTGIAILRETPEYSTVLWIVMPG